MTDFRLQRLDQVSLNVTTSRGRSVGITMFSDVYFSDVDGNVIELTTYVH